MSSSTPAASTPVRACAACGEPGTGRFCAACGAPLGGAACAGCAAPLTAGAKFCHRCGLPAGGAAAAPAAFAGAVPTPAAAARGPASVMPWAVAFVALLALAAMAAGRNFASSKGGGLDAPLNALPQAALGEVPGVAPPGAGGPAGGMPDISQMTPREMADRLFDRVMTLVAANKADSASFFATMALQNYANMDSLDLDLRYDMGRIAEVAGQGNVVRAQADTILRQAPTHLLGLILAARGAAMADDATAKAGFERRLAAAAPAERARNLEEYQRHAADIDAALAGRAP